MNDTGSATITLVEKQKNNKHRYNVFLDGAFAFSVHEDVMIKFRLVKGTAVDRDTLGTVVQEDERHRCYNEAIRYIGRSPRAVREVQQHLQRKGYAEELIVIVLERLAEHRYVDDGQFAKQWTEHRIVSQRKGRLWVKQELKDKGLTKEHIQTALANIDEETEFALAYELAVKKWRTTADGDAAARKRKLAAYLLRRGYSLAIVNRILAKLKAGELEDVEE